MNYDEDVYDKLLENFELLRNIIRQNTAGEGMRADLSKLGEIINNKIPDTLKGNAPEDFYELYTDFKAEYEKFRDFILYDKLIGKNIVALGGGFSSGKSSFLNAMMGRNVLPAAIDPSTSVPTYIVKGDKHEVMGINVFDSRVAMQPRDIRKIAHGFGRIDDDDDETVTDTVTLGHILENIFFSTPWHEYANIAFLDTPGYSKPDSEEYSAKTDEKIARGQLNSSNYILWFVQADAGTITEEDIKFLKTLRADIPKLIIVNKADKKNVADLKAIVAKVKENLTIKGMKYIDVLAFTSKPDQIADDDLRAYIDADTAKIRAQIEAWNTQVYESSFAKNFKHLFVRCKEFYEEEINEESMKLARLNTSLTRLGGENIDDEILEPLKLMVNDAKRNLRSLKAVSKNLKDLQDEFFTEIKYISDIVGISMPEPSEIDLMRDDAADPLELIEEYRRKKGNKTDVTPISDILTEMFDGVEPTISKMAGGTEYRAELEATITEMFEGIKPTISYQAGGTEYAAEIAKLIGALKQAAEPVGK